MDAHEAGMAITRTSLWSGMTRTMVLPITAEQLAHWEGGMLIQQAMPQLTAAQREFVVSGMTSEEWAEFGVLEDSLEGDRGEDLGDLHARMQELRQSPDQGHDQGMSL